MQSVKSRKRLAALQAKVVGYRLADLVDQALNEAQVVRPDPMAGHRLSLLPVLRRQETSQRSAKSARAAVHPLSACLVARPRQRPRRKPRHRALPRTPSSYLPRKSQDLQSCLLLLPRALADRSSTSSRVPSAPLPEAKLKPMRRLRRAKSTKKLKRKSTSRTLKPMMMMRLAKWTRRPSALFRTLLPSI